MAEDNGMTFQGNRWVFTGPETESDRARAMRELVARSTTYRVTFGGADGVSTHLVRTDTTSTTRALVEALMSAHAEKVKVNGIPAVIWLNSNRT